MFNKIRSTIQNSKILSRSIEFLTGPPHPETMLGRWKIKKGSDKILSTMANHDHCGVCGTPDKVSYSEIIKSHKNQRL